MRLTFLIITAVGKFSELNNQYDDYNVFLIDSDEITKGILEVINSEARKSKGAITEMRRALSLIENPGFGPEFTYKDLEAFPIDGLQTADFFAGEFNLWNLQDWSNDALKRIENEIEPMKTEIIAYDRELTDYKSNLFAGGSNGKGGPFL